MLLFFLFCLSSPQKFPQFYYPLMDDTKVLKTAEMILKVRLRDLEFPNLCSYWLYTLGSKFVSGTTSFFCFLSAKHTAILVLSFQRNYVENDIYLEYISFLFHFFWGGSELFFLISALWFSSEGTVPPLALVGPWKARVSCCQAGIIKCLLGLASSRSSRKKGVWVSETRLADFLSQIYPLQAGLVVAFDLCCLPHALFCKTSLLKCTFSRGNMTIAWLNFIFILFFCRFVMFS